MVSIRALAISLSLVPFAIAQVYGADCSYPTRAGYPRLCVPRFCEAPEDIKETPWAQQILQPLNSFPGVPNLTQYNFTAHAPDGRLLSVTFAPRSNLIGYNLEEFCEDISLSPSRGGCDGSSCPPSPPPWPLYSREEEAPRGCHAISLLPTLEKSLDLDLTALWVVIIVYLFYGLALVCEEFFVPAINLVCEKLAIPDDIAGATLLAIGCNSPEMFASIISVFVADSTVGVGTVVGSTPFNLYCITAGSALAITGGLKLDVWQVGRELFALLVSICLFFWIMDDSLVEWWEALIMVLFYLVVYLPVLIFFPKIQAFLQAIFENVAAVLGTSKRPPRPKVVSDSVRGSGFEFAEANASSSMRMSMRMSIGDRMSMAGPSSRVSVHTRVSVHSRGSTDDASRASTVLTHMKEKVKELFHHVEEKAHEHDEHMGVGDEGTGNFNHITRTHTRHQREGGGEDIAHAAKDPEFGLLVNECRNRLAELDGAEFDGGFKGQLLKKRQGFSKVQMLGVTWPSYNFIIDDDPVAPFRYAAKRGDGFFAVPLEKIESIEAVGGTELHLHTHLNHEDTICLRLPPGEPPETMLRWFDQIVVKVDELGFTVGQGAKKPKSEAKILSIDEDSDHHLWYAMPKQGSLAKLLFVLTFPVKAVVFTTTPDVLNKKTQHWYPLTLIMSVVWLGIFAFAMNSVIEYLGCGLGLDSTLMGLSLGAVGTSFPNFYASVLLAKSGQGGMAICQAIASNTFNICICLGLVWLLHSGNVGSCDFGFHAAHKGQCGGCFAPDGFPPLCPYWEGAGNHFGQLSGSTKGALLFSGLWMAGFVIVLKVFNRTVPRAVGVMMLVLYVTYILYQLLAAYGVPIKICFPSLNFCI